MSLRYVAFLPAAAAGALQLAASPNHDLKVGDGQIDGRILRPYANAWQVRTRRPSGQIQVDGVSSDLVDERRVDGRRYFIRIEGTTHVRHRDTPGGGVDSTFNVFDAASLAPRMGEARALDGSLVRHEFDGRTVLTTTVAAGALPASRKVALPEPVLDFNGGMTGLILAALPLRRGYAASLPILGDDGFERASVRVLRLERVRAGRLGIVAAWRIQASDESTYWVRKSAPYVIRVEVRGPAGVTTWEMI